MVHRKQYREKGRLTERKRERVVVVVVVLVVVVVMVMVVLFFRKAEGRSGRGKFRHRKQ